MKQLAALCLFLVRAVSAEARTVAGAITGTITIDGKRVVLDHVVAIQKDRNVRILISDRAVTPAQLADIFVMREISGISGVEAEITPDGHIPTAMIYSPLLIKSGGNFSAAENHRWEGTINADTIEGKLSGPHDTFADPYIYEYTATFRAPIASGAALVNPPPVPKGKPLPVGGGEPGKAYRDYLKALRAGDVAKIRASINAERAKQTSDEELKKVLPALQSMMPNDVNIGTGAVDGDHATLNVTSKDKGTTLSSGIIGLVREEGAWKIEKESWRLKSQ